MNRMEEVAKMLGVELGEKFKINFHGDVSSDEYYIDENSIHEICDGKVNDYCYPLLIALLNGTDTVVKISQPILNENEREYLSAVIRPFRKGVASISKHRDDQGAYIVINLYLEPSVLLPYINVKEDFTAMELGKNYTLKELGL